MNSNKAFEIIEVNFFYNGDLGKLQHKTIVNKEICNRLLINGIINRTEYDEVMTAICDHFLEQINKVVDNPSFYTNF